jgi:hypothetical protein
MSDLGLGGLERSTGRSGCSLRAALDVAACPLCGAGARGRILPRWLAANPGTHVFYWSERGDASSGRASASPTGTLRGSRTAVRRHR